MALFLRFQEANPNAANALLKTLEEAPAHVVLLLTADTVEQLLPTITSRCEILRLRPLPVERLEVYLKERGAGSEQAQLLAHISGGRSGYALHLLDNKDALKFRKERLDDLLTLLRSTRRERFAYAEKMAPRIKADKEKVEEDKKRFRETLLLWLSFWRDLLLRAAGSDAPLVNVDYTEFVDALATRLTLPEVLKLVSEAEGAIDKLERNVNARLLAEVTLLDWPKVL